MKKLVIGTLSALGVLFVTEKLTKHIVRVNNIERELNKVKGLLEEQSNNQNSIINAEVEELDSLEEDYFPEGYWEPDDVEYKTEENEEAPYEEEEPYAVYKFPNEAKLEAFIDMYGSVAFARYAIDDKYYASVENCLDNEPLEKYGAEKLQGEELKEFFEDTTVESRFIYFKDAPDLEKYVEMAYKSIKPEERIGVAKYKGSYFVSIEQVSEKSKVFLRNMASEYMGELVFDRYEDAKIEEVFNR